MRMLGHYLVSGRKDRDIGLRGRAGGKNKGGGKISSTKGKWHVRIQLEKAILRTPRLMRKVGWIAVLISTIP